MKSKPNGTFNAQAFLDSAGVARKIVGPGEFFGEGCLAGQPVRMGSATATSDSTVLLVDKERMLRLLHKQHGLSDRFIAHMLARNIRIEEDLVDQLFNSSEKRLARALLTVVLHD